MRSLAVAVLAAPPSPEALPKLLEAYLPDWVTGLYAAALRDTLDGLLSIAADSYWVFASEKRSLDRHIHAPWQLVASETKLETDLVLFARPIAPSANVEALASEVHAARNSDEPWILRSPCFNGLWAYGSSERLSATDVRWDLVDEPHVHSCKVHTLESSIAIDEPDGVLALFDELRRHPERAPRTAQFMVTRG